MEEFSILTIIFNVLWILFWFWMGTKIVDKLKARDIENNELEDEAKENLIVKHLVMIKTEIHGGIIFAFNEKNDSFITQGPTIESIAESAYKYKNIDLALIKHKESDFWMINGKISEVNVKLL